MALSKAKTIAELEGGGVGYTRPTLSPEKRTVVIYMLDGVQCSSFPKTRGNGRSGGCPAMPNRLVELSHEIAEAWKNCRCSLCQVARTRRDEDL